ncbi:ISSpo3, transposase [Parvularcula bermudensis HTCC2503]|uniref:ISSpo3, transposase n=1 Tax=Parvularcula bermudensis (strain ATCC BAA-594 / HTCC2503 / KCTC 12087) TaxID=314260 RepID=E0TD17_PARBH|nr:ISSpo3, transposase [Parvularcula bermudensis HTCC2503]
MHLFSASRNGVSAKEVERQIGVTYKTAWCMCKLILAYMTAVDGDDSIGGDGKSVQVDETFVGG